MTTLVGIVTNNGDKAVILGSDMARTQTSWKPVGDVAYRQQRRTEGQKIYISDDKDFAISMTGIYDQPYIDFLSAILSGKIDLRKAVKEGDFPELRNLNHYRWEGKVPNEELMNGLLVASRFDEPRLFTCFPMGRVEERPWTSIGSGSEYVIKYISEKGLLIPREVSIDKGIDLVTESLEEAAQDPYTGGTDIVVGTREDYYDIGKQIKEAVQNAKHGAVKNAKSELRKKITKARDIRSRQPLDYHI